MQFDRIQVLNMQSCFDPDVGNSGQRFVVGGRGANKFNVWIGGSFQRSGSTRGLASPDLTLVTSRLIRLDTCLTRSESDWTCK